MVAENKPSDLQIKLAHQVVEWLVGRQAEKGMHVPEAKLADEFGVSRSPMRSALELLLSEGLLEKIPNRGYFLTQDASSFDQTAVELPNSEEEELYRQIARDRLDERLEEHVSEADLMRRYSVTRGLLKRVLGRLTDDGIIERSPGHGWRFLPALLSVDAHDESYAFRLLIEPASFDQPGFEVDEALLRHSRAKHQELIEAKRDISTSQMLEVNADFHEMLARFSNNRYLVSAIQLQNRLRRLMEIQGLVSRDRVRQSCLEHLEIIEALENEDRALAQVLLRRHLTIASRLKIAFSD